MPLTSIDLFAGAGGLSYGLAAEGFNCALACDFERAAVDTYRANIGDHAERLDLSRPEPRP